MSPYGDMPATDLRRHGYRAVDWVADYLSGIGDRPVLARVGPGEILARIPQAPPDDGEPMETILADLDEVVLPGITHWNHPRFHAYFAITGSGPGIIGELVTAALNVNGMLWRTSPSATELEQAVLDWLRQLIGLPHGFRGVIHDTASVATLCALAAARERAIPDARQRGLAAVGERPRVYASEESHSSVEKACITLGFGRDGLRAIPTDDAFRMDVQALRHAIDEDVAAGWRPIAVVATAGTTSTTSIDPVPAIADLCREQGLWLHVDGAYGGTAAMVPEFAWVLDGAEHADSVVVNPHKWLFTPIDCSAFFVRDVDALTAAFSLVPEYLRTPDADVTNYMDWGIALGRRFRALKLWMVLRYFGREGLLDRIREHVRLAQLVVGGLEASDHFEVVAPAPLSTVCFRMVGDDDGNAALLEAVNASGRAFLSHTELRGRYVLRLSIGNLRTTEDDVRTVLALLEHEAARLSEVSEHR